ncbi:MAG: hypothetical protein IT260_12260 [Saprospiraceae bacterium]|nr:hypothetical protein [Saprospiraceae bacterium]
MAYSSSQLKIAHLYTLGGWRRKECLFTFAREKFSNPKCDQRHPQLLPKS